MDTDFSSETIEARKRKNKILKCLKIRAVKPKFKIQQKIYFRYGTEIKTLSDEDKLRYFIISTPDIKEGLKELLQTANEPEVNLEQQNTGNTGQEKEMINMWTNMLDNVLLLS